MRKEDIVKFEDLSQCGPQQSNMWEDPGDAKLTQNNASRDLSL